jgi:hypothetical protein
MQPQHRPGILALFSLVCSPKHFHVKLGILIIATAATCFVTMFYGVAGFGYEHAQLVQQGKFSKYRFTPQLRSVVKEISGMPIHISEIEFKSMLDSFSLLDARASNPGGNTSAEHRPDKAIDGDPETTWLDFNRAPLIVEFTKPVSMASFRFLTADDHPEWDPARWKLEGSNGAGWTLLHFQHNDYPTPTARKVATEWFDWFDFDENHWWQNLREPWVEQLKKIGAANNAAESEAPRLPVDEPAFLQCRFTPLKLRRHDGATAVQLAEIEFMSYGVVLKQGGNAQMRADMFGGQSPLGEEPDKAIDGNVNTKWLDLSKGSMTISWERVQRITHFRFVTANDFSGRDPLQWKLHCTRDQHNWALWHVMAEDYATPIVRRSPTGWFQLNLSAPAIPEVSLQRWDVSPYNWTGVSSFEYGNYSDSGADQGPQWREISEYCFTSTKLRNEAAGVVEISELEFMNESGIVTWPDGTFTQTRIPEEDSVDEGSRRERPDNAIDGNASTMWASMHPSTLCVVPSEPVNVNAFRFRTGKKYAERDPVQWELKRVQRQEYSYGGGEKSLVALIHAQTEDYPVTTFRHTSIEWLEVDQSAAQVVETHWAGNGYDGGGYEDVEDDPYA